MFEGTSYEHDVDIANKLNYCFFFLKFVKMFQAHLTV